jgi:serine/threonine-protein kinase
MMEKVGPYEIRRKIAEGGMGMVYLAWDPRLERQVALKCILASSYESSSARVRFLREARIQAKLDHENIVSLHDLIEGATQDFLVLAYVEGLTLYDYLQTSQPSIQEKLDIAIQIAKALAFAHQNEVIHRDIKLKNILIDSQGKVKITDFGIAKVLDQTTLTHEHQIVGSLTSLSPEQAAGKPMDHRSDLFAFGSLLYQLFTGQKPFVGDTPAAVISQICNVNPTPPHQVEPSLPLQLSQLIMKLLQKDPDHRPMLSNEVVADLERSLSPLTEAETREALPVQVEAKAQKLNKKPILWVVAVVILLGVSAFWFVSRFEAIRPVYVAVLPVTTPDNVVPPDWIPAVREACLSGVVVIPNHFSVDPRTFEDIPTDLQSIVSATAADELIRLHAEPSGPLWRISLRRINGQDGSVIYSEAIDMAPFEPLIVREATFAMLQRSYLDRGAPGVSIRPGISQADYREFLRLRDLLKTRQSDLEDLFVQLKQLLARSPDFGPLYASTCEAARLCYRKTRDRRFVEEGYQIAQEGIKRLRANPGPYLSQVALALAIKDEETAGRVLDELRRLFPGFVETDFFRARLLETRGDTEQALQLMREVAVLRPTWSHRFNLANMAFRHSQTELARTTLQDLLEDYPEHLRGLRLLANIELMQGSPAKAIRLYESVLKRRPSIYVWNNLGLAQMLEEDYRKAAASFSEAFELSPENPLIRLNVADALWLTGDKAGANEHYRAVVGAYGDDLETLDWSDMITLAQAHAHLGEHREAVRTIQAVLRIQKDNSQVSLAAGLVFTLIGDYQSAVLYTEEALAQGTDPRWFSLPWFEPIRARVDWP